MFSTLFLLLGIEPGKLIIFLKPTLTCSRAKLSCDLSYLAFHHMSHTASVTWHDVIFVEYCLWLVLYIIWISQLTCVKCPLPPKMCCLASSWFASCLSNCAPMFFHFHTLVPTFWNHQQCFWRVLHWNLLFTSWGWVCVIFLNNAETQAACSTALKFISYFLFHVMSFASLVGSIVHLPMKGRPVSDFTQTIVNQHRALRAKLEYQYQSQCECLWVCIMCICVVCPFRHTLSVLLITMWTLCCLSPT